MKQLSLKYNNLSKVKKPVNRRGTIMIRNGLLPSLELRSLNWCDIKYINRQSKAVRLIKSLYRIKTHKILKVFSNKVKGYPTVISKLETRLDVVVFRLDLARSILQAQKLISEGEITLNNKIQLNYRIFVGEGSEIKSKSIISLQCRLEASEEQKNLSSIYLHCGLLSGVIMSKLTTIVPEGDEPNIEYHKYFNNRFKV